MDRYWIVLNISRDRYYCLQHEDFVAVGLESAASVDKCCPQAAPRRDESGATLRSLISAGIVTSNPDLGKPFADTPLVYHSDVLANQDHLPAVSPFALPRFFTACVWTDWSLRNRPIDLTLATLRVRRDRLVDRAPEDRELVARLVGVFNRLRPLYPRSYRCLFDALALLDFLVRHGLSPKIVFGVIADPFQAHCWLQLGTLLINEDDERVRRFAPIMSA
jgi:hypothetical protein